MNLADMLSYADIQQLSRIASNYECECSGHSKNELIQSILTALNRNEVFERHICSMSMEDLRFLNSLLFEQRDTFSLEELIARAQQTKFAKEEDGGRNPRDTIAVFKQRGWLFNGYSQQTKYLFQIPQDLKRRFGDALAKRFQADLTTIEEPAFYRDEQRIFSDDIHRFLHYLYHQEVALAADGSMYKRHVQQILDRLTVKEEPVTRTGWRFGYGRRFKEYPNRFSLIYDYCYYNHLIAETDSVLTLTDKGREKVLEEKREDPAHTYKFWLRLYKGPIPNLQSLVHWIERLSRNWVTVQSLGQALCKLIKPFYYDSAESILEQRILRMMMHLGLLRIGEDERSGAVVQITKLGSGIIQGTYVPEEDKIDLSADSG